MTVRSEKRGSERKEGQTGYYERGMRAVKAFGVFIRPPKPRALLPIRLVDTDSRVNEMQSRETLTCLCQSVALLLLSSSADAFFLLSVRLCFSSSVSQPAALNLRFFSSLSAR